MTIDELDSRTGFKSITITMSYEEVRDTANGLYNVPDKKYDGIEAKWEFMFNMIKHGMIMPETVKRMNEINNRGKENKTKAQEDSNEK
jgi:hypothetical protein